MSLPYSNILTEESSKILHKIAPRWMHVLDNAETFNELVGDGRTVMDEYLSLSKFGCCIVGEINCFNSKYADTQDEMSSYSRSLYDLADIIARLEKRMNIMARELAEVFFEMLNQMVRYLQDNHKDLIRRKTKEYATVVKQLQEVANTNPNTNVSVL